jgi:general secretion pathway protein D
MVPNGGTLVIGGLMEDDDEYQQSGLPGLSRLPILGHLFGTREKIDQRRELVVLLTPHIWSPGQVGGNPDELATQGSKGSKGDVRQALSATTAALASNPPAATPTPSPAAVAAEPSPGLAPATLPPLPPLSSRSALLPVETIEVSRRTKLSGTLESQPEPLPADLLASSKSHADPQPVSRPQPARVAKVDPMISQASLEATRVSQSIRPAVPEEARPASRRHVVRPGEDFSSIARDYYGSPRLARALWWVNRKTVAWPGALVAGTKIVIPPIEQLEGKSGGPRSSRAATLDPQVQQASQNRPAEGMRDGQAATHVVPAPDQERPATDASPPEGGFAIHVVQPHETLRGIARDRLGDPRRFQEIAELNRDLLTDGRLSPGMRLLLPHDARPAPLRRD